MLLCPLCTTTILSHKCLRTVWHSANKRRGSRTRVTVRSLSLRTRCPDIVPLTRNPPPPLSVPPSLQKCPEQGCVKVAKYGELKDSCGGAGEGLNIRREQGWKSLQNGQKEVLSVYSPPDKHYPINSKNEFRVTPGKGNL